MVSFLGWGLCGFASAAIINGAIINEPMTNVSAPNWVIGGTAYLTASGGLDPAGSGWLRLTDVAGNQAGSAFLDSAFDISAGVVISFDYATWGGAGTGSTCGATGADGYSVYLFDGTYNASNFVVGASGGSLGYDKKTVAPIHAGLTGGYLGVGIDEWGNFSSPTEGRTGGPGMRCNGVAVRGPSNLALPYNYIGGTNTPIGTLAFPGYPMRPNQSGADYRKVVIFITPVGSNPVTDMRIDVYMQLGYTSALSQVLNGLMLGSGPPNNGWVKIGYAASTGGSTNIHEIRNLVIDPLPNSNLDLGITKLAASPTVVSGGTVTYSLQVRNYGPTNMTAAGVPITDTVPAGLTGVNWTCAGTGGAACGAASGSGNTINTTVTLPLNSYATYTITGTVTAAAGTQLTNTVTLTVPGGINDYNSNNDSAAAIVSVIGPPVTVSGLVFSDNGAGGGTAFNGVKDGGEADYTLGAVSAKLFRANDLTTTVAVVAVTAGTYTFNNVPSYQNYTIILSSTGTANLYDPSFPNNQWVFTKPLNYTLSNIAVGGVNLPNQNFGVYNGTRYGGRVIRDNGFNGSLANANDGVQNAAETGISGVSVSICNDAVCAPIDTTTTDAAGNYALFIDWANAFQTGTARITQTIPALNLMVSYNPGTATGTAVNTAAGTITATFNFGMDRSGILFGDVLDNTFAASQAKNALTSTTIYYAHTFLPGSGGTVTFAQNSRVTAPAAPAWAAAAYYQDNNCNGSYDGVDTVIAGSLTAFATTPICILAGVAVPAAAAIGATDALVTRATFLFTNSDRPANSTYDVTDTTTVITAPDLSTSTKTVVDLNGAPSLPNHVLRYTISVKETAGVLATGVTVTDNIPANVTGFSVVSFSSGIDSSTFAGTGSNNTGYLNITNMSVAANGTATIVFDVTIAPGTPAGTVINNSAAVTPLTGPGGTPAALPVMVGPFVSISGMVYSDANHNGTRNGGEVSSNVAGIYAKLFLASDLTTAVSVTPVVQATGVYTFNSVPSDKTYTVVLSGTSTNAFDPSFPGADWTYTSPVSYTLPNVVAALANMVNQDFGVYNGSRINGMVLRDDGAAAGFALANNGIQDAAEPGIPGVTVKIALDSAPTGTLDLAVTDANGAFILYTNTPTASLRISEVANPARFVSVNFNEGITNGTYVMAGDYILFNNYTRYTDYSGVVFSDVPDNTFAPTTQAVSSSPSTTVYYAHTFTPGSGGSVSFAQNARTTLPAAPAWPAVVYYQDNNCSGTYDGGDALIAGALNTTGGTAICILAAAAVPSGAANNTTDALTIRATFTFTNSAGPVVNTYDVTDTTTAQASDLSTSTKTWVDPNGGDQDPNETIQYTITLKEIGNVAASGVSVSDTFPATLTNLNVVSCPTGSCSIVSGQTFSVSNASVSANGTAVFVVAADIVTGTVAGTTIDNCATITNPGGTGAAPCAVTITVSASGILQTGNKQLYLYDNTSSPQYKLSRTKPSGLTGTATVLNGGSQAWTLDPALASGVTTTGSNVTVNLWLANTSAVTRNRTVQARLACFSAPGTFATSGNQNLSLPAAGSPSQFAFNLTGNLPMNCAATDSWLLTVYNNTGTNGRDVYVYPMSGTNNSYVHLPSRNVINVDSVAFYDAAYSGGSALASVLTGTTVYVRSVISDPFGSYDITGASIIVTDSTGSVRANAAMAQVADSGAATKTYEYAYAVPAGGPAGNWTARVTGVEGTEGTVSDYGQTALTVISPLPNLLVLKSVATVSDPVNGAVNPKAIPGAVMLYTITVINSGQGPADNNTTVITDAVPPNTTMYVDTGSGDPVTFSCSAVPPCGLTYNYGANVRYTDTFPLPALLAPPNVCGNFTYTPTGSFDANVRGVCINPGGVLNGASGPPDPQFTVQFRVMVN